MTVTAANAILAEWNGLSLDDASEAILPCNGSPVWATLLAYNRPFHSPEALFAKSDEIWRSLPEEDWQEAFDSHPRLGELKAQAATAQSLSWSAQEQSAAHPDDALRAALAQANREYKAKFGRIFLLCATGRGAAEMLEILRVRINNDAATELQETAEQQRLITQLRLRKWLQMPAVTCSELAASAKTEAVRRRRMGLSTHILDTSLGKPAANVEIELFWRRENAAGGAWQKIGSGRTDVDGRCKTLLDDQPLQAVDYKLRFMTAAYFHDLKIESLYPDVEIVFTVRHPSQHYHIPLLLAANGYTTYRGS